MTATFEMNVRCGDCVFFTRHTHRDYAKPCGGKGKDGEGKLVTSLPCRHFSPDARGVRKEAMLEMLRVFSALDKKERHISAAVLRNADALDKTGYYLGQKVIVRLRHADYLMNFRYAHIVGMTTDNRILILGDEGFTGLVQEKSLLPLDKWVDKMMEMIHAGRYDDPDLARPPKRKRNRRDRNKDEDIPYINEDTFAQAFQRSVTGEKERRGGSGGEGGVGRTYSTTTEE